MFENINFAPLPGSIMAISIIGALLTSIYADNMGTSWTFTLVLFFIMMFVASFLSLHYGPIPERELPRR